MTREPARVLVLAVDADVLGARIEATLRDDRRFGVVVGRPSTLGRLLEEHDPAVVVLVTRSVRLAAPLATIVDAPHAPPIVLVVDDPRAAWTPLARRAGARAVLRLDATGEEISAAITAAMAGLIALHPDVFSARSRPQALEAREEERTLTARELEILDMLAEGLSNRTIARRLDISTYTVKFHVASILAKLQAGSRTEAVTIGVRRGLISL